MVLAFVGGTMNLIWMGFATALMAFEKFEATARYLRAPIGMVLIFAGGFALATQ